MQDSFDKIQYLLKIKNFCKIENSLKTYLQKKKDYCNLNTYWDVESCVFLNQYLFKGYSQYNCVRKNIKDKIISIDEIKVSFLADDMMVDIQIQRKIQINDNKWA